MSDSTSTLEQNVETNADIDQQVTQAYEAKSRPMLIAVSKVRKSEIALRDADRGSEAFQNLLQSIRSKGILQPILVRELRDENTGGVTYGLVDGLQRFSCACDLNLDEIPANVVDLDDAEMLEAQIITNLNRIETKPAAYTKQLIRMCQMDATMTEDELCRRLGCSKSWLKNRLSLNKLSEEIQELVDNGQINLTNAFMLAKLPAEEQSEHTNAAITEDSNSFVPRMKARLKEIKEASKAGSDAAKAEWQPVQVLRKVAELKEAFASNDVAERLIKENNPQNAVEAFNLALSWVLSFDAASQAEQKARHEEREKKAAEKKEKMKAEREELKKKKEAEAAVSLTKGY